MRRMPRLGDPVALAALLAVLAWPVLLGFERILSPEPLLRYALLAGWCAAAALAASGAGALLLPRRRGRAAGEAVLAALAGAGLLSMAATLAGIAGVLRPATLTGIAALAAVAGLLRAGRWVPEIRGHGPRLPRIVLAAAAVITALPLVTDSSFYDQLNYHLAAPALWLRHGRLDVIPGHDYTCLPLAASALYTYALATLGPWAAQALHWLLGAGAVAAAALLARGAGGREAAWWAAALLAATPSVMLNATWAASDMAAAAFGGLAWLAVLEGERMGLGGARRWALAGLGAGLAAAAKATAAATVAAPVGVFAAAAAARRLRRGDAGPALGGLAAFGLAAGAALAPWLVRNGLAAGDPLFPLVGGSFVRAAAGEATGLAAAVPRLLGLHLLHRGAAGIVGPVWALLLPLGAAVAVGRRDAGALRLLAATGLGLAGWLAVPALGRYLLPALLPAAALAGVAAAHLAAGLPAALRRAVTGALAFTLAWGALAGVSLETVMRGAVGLGLMSRQEWLARSVDYWPAAQVINTSTEPDAKVLLVGEARTLYIERDVVARDPFQEPYPCELARRAPGAGAMASELRRLGIRYVLINHNEERRIARMTGRSRFLECLDPAGAAAYRRLLEAWTEPIYAAGGVEVRRLRWR